MAVSWTGVYSSNVNRVGYDDESQTLLVEWAKGGRMSSYQGVPADVAGDAAKAWSVGNFINQEVKGRYAHKYV